MSSARDLAAELEHAEELTEIVATVNKTREPPLRHLGARIAAPAMPRLEPSTLPIRLGQ